MNVYLPTGTLVLISWISFFVPAELVPGRMALLVTIFLMLVNISNSARSNAPKVNKLYRNTGLRAKCFQAVNLTALDVWLLGSMCFVAMALMEYAVLLSLRFETTTLAVRHLTAVKTCLLSLFPFRRSLARPSNG